MHTLAVLLLAKPFKLYYMRFERNQHKTQNFPKSVEVTRMNRELQQNQLDFFCVLFLTSTHFRKFSNLCFFRSNRI